MLVITFAWTTHEFSVYGYDSLDFLTYLFDPIAKNQFKIIGFYDAEEPVKSVVAGNRLQIRDSVLEKVKFRIPKCFNLVPRPSTAYCSRNGYIYDGFHFMHLPTIHSWVLYLLTYVNYAYFHVNYCS